MGDVPEYFYNQSAVVPYRIQDGRLDVLLITSYKGRWIVPKGVVEPALSAQESAAQEAWEEAGVRGVVEPEPLGRYHDRKWGGVCEVLVFPMRVTEVAVEWPEQDARDRRWVECQEAQQLVSKTALRELIAKLPDRL